MKCWLCPSEVPKKSPFNVCNICLNAYIGTAHTPKCMQILKEMSDELYRKTSAPFYSLALGQSGIANQGTFGQAITQSQLAQQRSILAQQAFLQSIQGQAYGTGGGGGGGTTTGMFSVTLVHSYPHVKHEGIRAGEIIAWRAWRIEKGFLQSASVRTIWAPGEPMEGDVKQHGCYSYKKKADALKHMLSEMGTWPCVVGSVQIWGEIVEHELGYRSQFAKIVSLDYIHQQDTYLTEDAETTLMRLKRKYLP